jgi:RepB DNA-primase from phage plasmid
VVPDIKEAFKMLDIFASCGAQSFVVTKTELEWPGHKKAIWGKPYPIETLRQKLPAIVRTSGIRRSIKLPDESEVMSGENVIIRPTGRDVAFVQLDDLKTQEQIDRIRPAAFIIHETSPSNRQAWIAVSGVPEGKEQFKEFTRRVRRAMGANDTSASHATRLAGTENWKTKYLPKPPTVSILEAHPGRIMTPAQLEELHLLAEPERTASVLNLRPRRPSRQPGRERQWADYARCLLGAPPNSSGNGPSRSHADSFFCKLAAQSGWSIEETEQKLLEVSEKARERVRCGDEGYAHITAVNAAAAARQGRRRSRG